MSAPIAIRVFTCKDEHVTVQSPGDLPVEHCYECGRGDGITYVDYVSVEALVTDDAVMAGATSETLRQFWNYWRGKRSSFTEPAVYDNLVESVRMPIALTIRYVLEHARP